MSGPLRRGAHRALAPFFRRAGHAYLAAPTRSSAVMVADRLMSCGYRVTVGYWHADTDGSDNVLAENLALVDALAARGGDWRVAVKTPGLGSAAGAVTAVARAAKRAGGALTFDAHAPGDAAGTLRLAEAASAEGCITGVAVPARWARSATDVQVAAAAGLAVRLVKGQWADGGAEAVRPGEDDLRGRFLSMVDRLARHPAPVLLATHDAVALEAALPRLLAARTTTELELLLGLPAARALAAARRFAVPVRFYLAYGHPSLAFSPRSALRRPRLALTLAEGVTLGSGNQQLRQREALRYAPKAVPAR